MFNITILAVGKLKEKYYLEAFQEYLKRLSPYAKVVVEELKAEAFTSGNKAKAKEAEGERINNYLEKHASSQIIVMDEHGQELTSAGFAEQLCKVNNHIVFVIGGSLGLSEAVLKKHQMHYALSKLTLPHELARVFLVEQIYRAITIIKEKEYHY